MAKLEDIRGRFSTSVEVDDVSVELSALRADMRLYFDIPFDEIADDVLPVHDDLWTWLGRERFGWWRNEGMSLPVRMHGRTHTTLQVALRRARPKHIGLFSAKGTDPRLGADGAVAVPDVSIEARWHTRGGYYDGDFAGELRALDRVERLLEDPIAWRDRVLALCEALPVKSGVAGFVIEQVGLVPRDLSALFGAAMRHPGADLDNDWNGALAEPNAIKGVNWLTIVGLDGVRELGGLDAMRAQLDASVTVHETKHAVVLQAGPAPSLGDINRGDDLPAYRAAYRVVAPLHAAMIASATAFAMGRDDDAERTEAWLRRFEPRGAPGDE